MRSIFLAALIRFSVVLWRLPSVSVITTTVIYVCGQYYVLVLCLIPVTRCTALLNCNAMLNYTEDNASPILGYVIAEISSDVTELNLILCFDFCIHFLIILTSLARIPSWISWIISFHNVVLIIESNRLV